MLGLLFEEEKHTVAHSMRGALHMCVSYAVLTMPQIRVLAICFHEPRI